MRLGGVGYPPITGVLVNVAGRTSFLGVERVSEIGTDGVVLRKAKLDLRHFERRPEEVLLQARPARPPADQRRGRAARARERDRARAASPAPGASSASTPARAAGCAGCCRRRSARTSRPASSSTGPASSRSSGTCPTVRLRVPHPKLAKLHPAQIADLVEAASRHEGEEIIQAVGDDDRELEADVFEELDDQHQREFLEDRPDAQVAEILSRMAPDDAADVIGELDEDRREPRARAAAGQPPRQGARAARLRPGRGRRADEPRLRPAARLDLRRRRARRGAPQPRSRRSC